MTGLTLGTINNVENVVDSNKNNFATIFLPIGVVATGYISVKDQMTDYPAGYFAGFEVSNSSLVGLGLLNNCTVTTYLNGTQRETKSANELFINAPLFSGTGRQTVGFKTGLSFDEVRYTVNQVIGVDVGITNVYNAVIKHYCEGPPLACNEQTSMVEPTFPVNVDVGLSGINGLACVGCSVNNTDNVIDQNTANSATIVLTVGVGTSGSIAVKDGLKIYPSGTFAGFEYQNPNLVGVNILNSVQIKTYLDGVLKETSTNATLIAANSSLLDGTGRQIAGFMTTQPFNTVQITINQFAGVTLGTTQVFRAVFQNPCQGPPLNCNTTMNMVLNDYPVAIDNTKTGIDGLACVGCNVNNSNNVINPNTNDHADIVLLVGVGISGSIAVRDMITNYPAGTFVGFDVENPMLLDVNVLNGITVKTFLNGTLKESKTGTGNLLALGTSILTDDGRRMIGFITNEPFDEAQLTVANFVGVNFGTTKVYKMVTKKFCAGPMDCDTTYFLNEPTFPVVVDGGKTGIKGAVCGVCSVEDAPNVISASNSDYATITVAAGILSTGSLAVQNGIQAYPAGSTAGFVVQDMNNLLQVDLLSSLVICTYLHGTLQECRSANDLIDLAALINWIGMGPGKYNLGFRTTKPFDEIEFKVGSLASGLNIIRVYSAFVDTRGAYGPGFENCKKNTTDAVNDQVSTYMNVPASGNVTTNDFDLEGDVQTFGSFLNPTLTGVITSGSMVPGVDANGNPVANAGTLTFDNNGNYVFTPTPGFIGNVSVGYSICDNGYPSACDTAFLQVTVSPLPNKANSVIATNDEYSTFGATVTGNVTGNDSDPQGDSFSVTSYNYDSNGDGTLDANGTIGSAVTVSGIDDNGQAVANAGTLTQNANGTFTFVPTVGFYGTVHYNYTITDNGSPVATDNADVVIKVLRDGNGVQNDAPFAGDDFATTYVNTSVNGNFISNDNDPNGDPLSMKNGLGVAQTIVPGGAHTLIKTVPTLKGGSVSFYTDGTYTYVPADNYVGPDEVVYQICDVTVVMPQPLCASATIHLLIGNKNTTDAVNDQVSTYMNVPASGNVTTNDFDLEGDIQTFGSFINPTLTGVIPSGSTVPGVDANGNPVANAGTLTFDNNGNYVFTPTPGFIGNVSVGYSICDNGHPSACDTAFLQVTVSPLPNKVNSVIATNDEYVSYGATVTGNVTGNDSDPQEDSFSVTSYKYDSNGDGTLDANGTIGSAVTVSGIDDKGQAVANAGTLTQNANGTFTFVPTVGFYGTVRYNYTITDNGSPVATDNADVVITILRHLDVPTNDPPFAGDDFKTTYVNTPVNGNFISNDNDPNNDLLSMKDSLGVAQTLIPGGAHTLIKTVPTLKGGSISFFTDGTYTYTPAKNYVGPDEVVYQICDVVAVPLCANATIHLLIGLRNTTNAVNDQVTTMSNIPISGNVTMNDFDLEGDVQTFGSFLNPTKTGVITSGSIIAGVDTNGNLVANAGTLTFDNNGNYTFTPNISFVGDVIIPYNICDNGYPSVCDTATLTIKVSLPPLRYTNSVIANDDNYFSFGSPISNDITINDADPEDDPFTVTSYMFDSNGDGIVDAVGTLGSGITVAGVNNKGQAVVNAGTLIQNSNGTFTFTPTAGFYGNVTYRYTITDQGAPVAKDSAYVTLHILEDLSPDNDAPIAGNDFAITYKNVAVNGNFIANDFDLNGDPLSMKNSLGNAEIINSGNPHTSIKTVTTNAGGTLTYFTDGTFNYIPPTDFIGVDFVSYQICDVTLVEPQPLCANATIYLHVVSGPVPLPIQLLSFDVTKINNTALLTWITASEQNCKGFEIEHSIDSKNWESIGFVNSQAINGNSVDRLTYKYSDRDLAVGIHYYRLKQTDLDSRYNYTSIRNIEISDIKDNVTIYPNPVTDNITVAGLIGDETIRIYDAVGKLVIEQNVNDNITTFSLSGLAEGMYLLHVISPDGNNFVHKFLKSN